MRDACHFRDLHGQPKQFPYLFKVSWQDTGQEPAVHFTSLAVGMYKDNLIIILNLFAYLFVCLSGDYSQIMVPKALQFLGYDETRSGDIITSLVTISLFTNSSQMLGPKGVVIRKFGGYQNGTVPVPVGLVFPPKKP